MKYLPSFLFLFLLVPSTVVFAYHEETTSSKQTGACEYYLQHPDDLHNMCKYKRSCEGLEYTDADRKSVLEEDYLIQLFLQNNLWASLQMQGAIGNFDIENPWRVGSQNYHQDRNMAVSLNACSDITSINYQDLSLYIHEKGNDGRAMLDVGEKNINDSTVSVGEGKYEIAKRIIGKHLSPKVQMGEFSIPSNKIHCNNDLALVQKHDGTPACVTESTSSKLSDRGWGVVVNYVDDSIDGFAIDDANGNVKHYPIDELHKMPCEEYQKIWNPEFVNVKESDILIDKLLDCNPNSSLQKVMDSCNSTGMQPTIGYRYSNGTHIITNASCEWQTIEEYENEN